MLDHWGIAWEDILPWTRIRTKQVVAEWEPHHIELAEPCSDEERRVIQRLMVEFAVEMKELATQDLARYEHASGYEAWCKRRSARATLAQANAQLATYGARAAGTSS